MEGSCTRLLLRFWPGLVVGGIVLGAGGLSAAFAARATHWSVMSDELQTAKLATSIADGLAILPQIHGERYGTLGQQLYPLLLSPLFASLGVPAAVHAAHIANGFLLASAAVPAYLLARDVTGSRVAGCVTAGLTAFVPWLVLSATLLTENAAYPAFVWGVLLCHRALVRPSGWRDAAAVGGLLLVYLARTQLFVLAVAFPIALLGHELSYVRRESGQTRLRALGGAARRAVSSHLLLAGVYLLGLAGVAALGAAGRLGDVFGNYVGTLHGGLLPPGIWTSAAAHIGNVVVALGIAPFLLATAWGVVTVLHPQRREAHAFALLMLLVVPLLVFEVASFDLRYTPGGFIQDRYLFYVAPLLAVGASAALLERERRKQEAALVLASSAPFAGLAWAASFAAGTVIFWASPASAFHPALDAVSGWVEFSADSLVLWAGVAIAAALALLLLQAPPLTGLAAVGAAVCALGAFEAVYVFDRYAVPATTLPRSIPATRADWVDAADPGRRAVTLVPSPYLAPEFWWDTEFWNGTVRYVLRVDGDPTFTPFPSRPLSIDPGTGRLRRDLPSDLLVETSVETRFHLAGTRTLAAAPPLVLSHVERPYRAEWTTTGADPDGWARPDRPVTVRVFPARGPGLYELAVTVSPPPGLQRPVSVRLQSRDAARVATLRPGGAQQTGILVCVPARHPGEATLTAAGGGSLPDGRVVSLHTDAIQTRVTSRSCTPRARPAS